MKHLVRFVEAASSRVEQGHYVRTQTPLPPNGSLVAALAGRRPVIAELKPRSPSEGRLLEDPAPDVLEDYKAGGAAALSILTDADHFDGSLTLLREAHATGLPTMMKDFVIDASQIAAAAHNGASAVLLIERILDPAQREALVAAAHDHGLEVLLEIFDDGDWATAQHSQADLIGVNRRDLDTLGIDAERQRRLIALARGRPVVALSGIQHRGDVDDLIQVGARAALVGTSLVRDPLRRWRLRGLQRPLAKVCGITDTEDLAAAIDAGADMVGFIVAAHGPRQVSADAAKEMSRIAQARGVASVMVTTAEADALFEAARAVRPTFVQWHGEGDIHAALQEMGIGLLLAHGPGQTSAAPCDGWVLDAPEPGSGATHDWDAAAQAIAARPDRISLIAGGLHAGNAAAAIQATGAWGADASSHLEKAPGRKDPAKVAAFVAATHG